MERNKEIKDPNKKEANNKELDKKETVTKEELAMQEKSKVPQKESQKEGVQDANPEKQGLHEQIAQRKLKLEKLRSGSYPFPNTFKPSFLAKDLHAQYQDKIAEELESKNISVQVAGRIITRRLMGKASFVSVQDSTDQIQLYVRKENIGDAAYEDFLSLDLGDIIGASGTLFKTKTGELSVKVENLTLLTKALRPLPDKWHGLSDHETRYRQRYLDLIANLEVKEKFILRSKIITSIREFLLEHTFLEVETPMMQAIPGGAIARPFITHHNALGIDLYLRIAPELYLKRLIVGGFDRVFEINRNFRNEGLSTRHNPEFTMLEFYQAYANYHDFMDFTEELLRDVVETSVGKASVIYQGVEIDFAKPFARLSIKEAIVQFNPKVSHNQVDNMDFLREYLRSINCKVESNFGLGKLQLMVFEETVEDKIQQPTFITEYPTEVSPLARINEDNRDITDRAELFIAGREIANLFSELNDPIDQAERFNLQIKNKLAGDLEAMHYDEDYITALEHGMPPCAGCGIGIDRLVMLLTDAPSIRDVLLFPHLRPQA